MFAMGVDIVATCICSVRTGWNPWILGPTDACALG